MFKQISMLNQELKVQEKHYESEIAKVKAQHQRLEQTSVTKDSDLIKNVQKIYDSQSKFQKEKASLYTSLTANQEAARQKIFTLEQELEQQGKFFNEEEK